MQDPVHVATPPCTQTTSIYYTAPALLPVANNSNRLSGTLKNNPLFHLAI